MTPTENDLRIAREIYDKVINRSKEFAPFGPYQIDCVGAIATALADQRERICKLIMEIDNTLIGPQHRDKLCQAIRGSG